MNYYDKLFNYFKIKLLWRKKYKYIKFLQFKFVDQCGKQGEDGSGRMEENEVKTGKGFNF